MSVQVLAPQQQVIDINVNYLRLKRAFDILFTVLLLLPLCIAFVLIAVVIKLDSPGSVFYRQKRIGWRGEEFYMYKFRSMYENCDDAIHRAAVARYMSGQRLNSDCADALAFKRADDPRITRVGKLLRKLSLDELPQFLNVLRGDMTLVGPRPPLPYECENYSERDQLRLSGKPGLTGPWQVYGRSRVPFDTMIEMDLAYLRQQSLREDLKLVALTVPVMVQGRGGA